MMPDISPPHDLESLLAFMREFSAGFQRNHQLAREQSDLQNRQAEHALLLKNVRAVASLAEQLGSALDLLTNIERAELFLWVGQARRCLADDLGADEMFTALIIPLSLAMTPDSNTDGFSNLVASIAKRSAPVLLERHHVAALDELLGRPEVVRCSPETRADVLVGLGVRHAYGTGMFIERTSWEPALGAALLLADLGLLAGSTSAGELLYKIGFRAELDD